MKKLIEYSEFCRHGDRVHNDESGFISCHKYLYLIRWFIIPSWRRIYCKLFDHDYESTDWGTPESGGIGVHCLRCGESHSHILY